MLVGLQHPIVAIGFGGVVAFCTSYFSGGRGLYYQLVATGFTLVGIVLAEALSLILLAYRYEGADLSVVDLEFIWNYMMHVSAYDTLAVLFYTLGVLGSVCIWR